VTPSPPPNAPPTLNEFSGLTRQLRGEGETPLTVVKPAGKEKELSIGG